MNRLIVALVQMQSGNDKEQNVSAAERLVNEAAGKGAKLVALPEYFSFGAMGPLQKENAESVSGLTVDRLRKMASSAGVYLIGGSLAEHAGDSEKVFNTTVMINPRGEIIAKYSKIHLFNLQIDDQTAIRESDFLEPGNTMVTADTDYGVIGLTICFDLRFPEIYRALTLNGAGIIFVVSSFMALTGRYHWEPLLRARAIENQVYIAAPNQAGLIPGTDQLRYGHSSIIDPWGTLLSQACEGEEVITAEIDLDYLARVRKQLPALSGRRPDVYASW
jgi:predicted amidohydrolase